MQNRLRYLRDEIKMKQTELASLLNVQRTSISKYENGVVPLTEDQIKQLCEIFDVSADYLIGISDIRDKSATTQDIIKVALFGDREIDDEVIEAVQRFAAFTAAEKKKAQKA